MPGERKRKNTEKNPKRKKAERKQSRRVNAWSKRLMNNLNLSASKKRHSGAFLAKIISVNSGNTYDVQKMNGTVYDKVPLAGKMKLKGKLHHNPEVTAARVGSYVFVEGGQIVAVLDEYNAQSARNKTGWLNAGDDDLFERKRPSASRSRSRSRSRSGSVNMNDL